jgi:hypothetical protein
MRQAGASYGPLVGQRPYWASRALVLNRQGLGTSAATPSRRPQSTGDLRMPIAVGELALLERR